MGNQEVKVKEAPVVNDQRQAQQQQQVNQTFIVQPQAKRKSSPIVRKATYNDKKTDVAAVRFVSEFKEAAIMYETPDFVEMIKFQNREFYTNKPEVISYLRNHEQFERAYWEGEFPSVIKNKLDRYEAELVRDKSDIEID